tara:strand:+ start:353 stop:619 length:267 start_codon:yes stop_codon:yes gene_type:complete
MKDAKQAPEYARPVTNNISFEVPAAIFEKGPPSLPNPLRKSKPPMKVITPNTIATCIHNFVCSGLTKLIVPPSKMGIPIKEGIQDVIE